MAPLFFLGRPKRKSHEHLSQISMNLDSRQRCTIFLAPILSSSAGSFEILPEARLNPSKEKAQKDSELFIQGGCTTVSTLGALAQVTHLCSQGCDFSGCCPPANSRACKKLYGIGAAPDEAKFYQPLLYNS